MANICYNVHRFFTSSINSLFSTTENAIRQSLQHNRNITIGNARFFLGRRRNGMIGRDGEIRKKTDTLRMGG